MIQKVDLFFIFKSLINKYFRSFTQCVINNIQIFVAKTNTTMRYRKSEKTLIKRAMKHISISNRKSIITKSIVFNTLSLIHISEPTRLGMISYAVFCLKKK